jgi:hypothetical protein
MASFSSVVDRASYAVSRRTLALEHLILPIEVFKPFASSAAKRELVPPAIVRLICDL